MSRSASKGVLLAALVAVAVGVVLRVASFHWNKQLYGDVNLFALTAREFVEHGRLYYPMKYEYSDHVPYKALASPSSQHPLLLPFASGLLGKVFGTDETFFILKALSLAAGLALLCILVVAGLRAGYGSETFAAVALVAVSPMLAEHSANGRFNMLAAVLIVLATLVLRGFRYDRMRSYVLAGLLCGVGLQVHTVLVCLPLAFVVFGLWRWRQMRWRGVAAFVATTLVLLVPGIVWSMHYFGKPFYSYNMYYFFRRWGIVEAGICGDVITTRLVGPVGLEALRRYGGEVVRYGGRFVACYLSKVGPFCLVLAVVGCYRVFRKGASAVMAFALPSVAYLLVVFVNGGFRVRYIVAVLPAAYVAAGIGFGGLQQGRGLGRLAGWVCLAGVLGGSALSVLPSLSSPGGDAQAGRYEKMLEVVRELEELEPGVVLGYSRSLDGGRETAYYHRFPFVYGRGFWQREEFEKLVRDFDVRYVWTDVGGLDRVQRYLPEGEILVHNDRYYVFGVPKEGGVTSDDEATGTGGP